MKLTKLSEKVKKEKSFSSGFIFIAAGNYSARICSPVQDKKRHGFGFITSDHNKIPLKAAVQSRGTDIQIGLPQVKINRERRTN